MPRSPEMRQVASADLTNYRADVDGLRAVAVLSVVLHHVFGPLLPGGYVGVDVFFVISGYLITRIIYREMAQGRFTFRGFYHRRARRIFPALFAMLAVTLAAAYVVLLPSDYVTALRAALGTLAFSSNLVFWREQRGYFDATEVKLDPLVHTWSLGVEEQFYVLYPVFLLLCFRFLRKRLFWVLLICALVSLAGAALLVKNNRTAVFYVSPFRAWELFAGALLALDAWPAAASRVTREVLTGGGLVAIAASALLYNDSTVFPGPAALVPVLGSAAIIYAGARGATWAGQVLTWRPMVYVGLISYSLYLWHWPLIVLAQYAYGMDPLQPSPVLLLAGSLLLAVLSYHLIEKPFRRGWAVRPQLVVPSTAGFVLLACVFCTAGLAGRGFPSRFPAAVASLDDARVPVVPYMQCGGHALDSACLLGRAEGQSDVLLWGDSHLVAWAPALHEILLQARRRAVLGAFLGCSPTFDIENRYKPACAASSAAVKAYLLEHPEIDTVVLSAFWATYFRDGGPLTFATRTGEVLGGVAAAQRSLAETVKWLRASGRAVVLIGPVPVYSKSVPAALALEASLGRKLLDPSAIEERRKNAPFLAAIKSIPAGPGFRFVNPTNWLCADQCQVAKDGVPLYRDGHHLSLPGAMELKTSLCRAMSVCEATRSRQPAVPQPQSAAWAMPSGRRPTRRTNQL